MLITINSSDSKYFSSYRIWVAEQIIWNYPMRATENAIEKLVWDSYKLTLKEACLKIIHSCLITSNEGSVTISLTDKKLDKLYRLITFGTGKIQGSNILLTALK